MGIFSNLSSISCLLNQIKPKTLSLPPLPFSPHPLNPFPPKPHFFSSNLLLSTLQENNPTNPNPNFSTSHEVTHRPSSSFPFPSANSSINPRTRTPLEKQFETWIDRLKPGFTHADVDSALRSQSDPDLALDIFRWTGQQRNFRHNAETYQTMMEICGAGHRFGCVETLIGEVVAGACVDPSHSLYNTMIKFCCSRRHLFNRAFDIFKKMQRLPNCKPTLETYTRLLHCLLRRFSRLNVSYVYLHAVRSLFKQMKTSGVIPDSFTLNLIIKAYSKCLEMDEAMRTFREMGLYGCEPNDYTYSYIAKGLCEKGRVLQGLGFYKEMRGKGFVPNSSTYMILICSLSLELRFGEGIEVLFDMLGNSMKPDLLTYKTLLEGLCRERRETEAFAILHELRNKEGSMEERTYSTLLDSLHLLCRG